MQVEDMKRRHISEASSPVVTTIHPEMVCQSATKVEVTPFVYWGSYSMLTLLAEYAIPFVLA